MTDEIKKGCERDIRKVEDRLRTIEKKMWTMAGSIAVISLLVRPVGQKIVTTITQSSTISTEQVFVNGSN